VNNLETAKQMAAEIRLTRSEVNRLEAAAEDLLTDLKETIRVDKAKDDDLRAFVVLQTLLRGEDLRPVPQDKLVAYERNIIAAENALKQAKADHDAEAYNRALWVLRWAKEGQDRLQPR